MMLSYMTVCLKFEMVTFSAHVGDGIYEKEIDTQNTKMSGLISAQRRKHGVCQKFNI